MATYEQLYKEFTPNLLQAPINPRAIRDLIVELRPQFAELTFFNSTPSVLALTNVPQQITLFDGSDSHNEILVPDDGTDTITVDADSDGIFGHFCIETHFDPDSDITVTFELYKDGAPFAQPVKKMITAKNGDWNHFEPEGYVPIEPGSAISLWVYKDSAPSVDVSFTQCNFCLQKIPLGLNSPFPGQILVQTLTAFDPIVSVLLQPAAQQMTIFDPVVSVLSELPTQQLTAFDPIVSVLSEPPTQQLTAFDPIVAVLGEIPTQQITVFGPVVSVLV